MDGLSYAMDPMLTLSSIAIGAAAYSMGRKMVVDKQLRLTRSTREK